jgi:hypothetical protein
MASPGRVGFLLVASVGLCGCLLHDGCLFPKVSSAGPTSIKVTSARGTDSFCVDREVKLQVELASPKGAGPAAAQDAPDAAPPASFASEFTLTSNFGDVDRETPRIFLPADVTPLLTEDLKVHVVRKVAPQSEADVTLVPDFSCGTRIDLRGTVGRNGEPGVEPPLRSSTTAPAENGGAGSAGARGEDGLNPDVRLELVKTPRGDLVKATIASPRGRWIAYTTPTGKPLVIDISGGNGGNGAPGAGGQPGPSGVHKGCKGGRGGNGGRGGDGGAGGNGGKATLHLQEGHPELADRIQVISDGGTGGQPGAGGAPAAGGSPTDSACARTAVDGDPGAQGANGQPGAPGKPGAGAQLATERPHRP